MRYLLLGVLAVAFALQIWFIYWMNEGAAEVRRAPRDPWLDTEVGTPHFSVLNAARPARATNNPALGNHILQGAVLDASGAPVADAQVLVEQRSLKPEDAFRTVTRPARWTTHTDTQGQFLLDTLPAGEFAVSVSGALGRALEVCALEEQAAPVHLTLTLAPAGSIAGQVITPGGTPVSGAWIYPVLQHNIPGTSPYRLFPVRSNPQGNFVLEDLPEGRWDLLAVARDHPPALARSVSTGEETSIRLIPGAQISGQVVAAEDGKTVNNMTVVVVEREFGLERYTPRTDASGVFRAEGLRPGEYYASLESASWAPADSPRPVRTGESGYVMTVERTGAVRGRVLASGDPQRGVENVPVRAVPIDPGRAEETVRTARQGYYVFSGLRPGEYVIELGDATQPLAGAPADTEASRLVHVAAGKRAQGPTFSVEVAREVRGVVVDSRDRPVPAPEVHLEFVASGERRTLRADAAGHFQFDNTDAGAFSVWAAKQGFQSEVYGPVSGGQPGQEIRLQIRIPSAGKVTGRVVNAQGRGIAGALIHCAPGGGLKLQEHQAVTDDAGTFRLESLPAAEYHLRIARSADTATLAERVVTITPETPEATVEVVLP